MIRRTIVLATIALSLGIAVPLHASDSATYTYDTHGRLWTVTYANGTIITYTYDSAGNRYSVVTTCSAGGC